MIVVQTTTFQDRFAEGITSKWWLALISFIRHSFKRVPMMICLSAICAPLRASLAKLTTTVIPTSALGQCVGAASRTYVTTRRK